MQPVDPEGVERLCLLDGVTLQPRGCLRHWVAGLSETAGSNATSCNKLASRMAAGFVAGIGQAVQHLSLLQGVAEECW